MSDTQEINEFSQPVKPKKTKKPMTAAQKEARLRNLQKGREKRLEMLKQKKQAVKTVQNNSNPYYDYDLDSSSSDDSDSSSSDEEIVIRSGRKRGGRKRITTKKSKPIDIPVKDKEIQELRDMVNGLMKKQNKPKRGREKTIVQVINNEPKRKPTNKGKDDELKNMFCKF